MALDFKPWVPAETFLAYRDQERPDYLGSLNQLGNTLNEFGGDIRKRRQLELDRTRQAMLDRFLANEESRKRIENESKYGRQPSGEMFMSPSPTMGQTRSFGAVPTAEAEPIEGPLGRYRTSMKEEDYRPEFQPFLSEEERKARIERTDPLKQAQAEWYKNRPTASTVKKYHFVDSTSHQMFDENMNPISLAPEGSTPKVIGNPYAGSEFARRDALVAGAVNSVNRSKEILNDTTLSELKGIRFTPGKMYSQIASPEGKELYRNLYNAIANQLYLKTGATANPSEIENNMIAYMPAANDTTYDMLSRLDMLSSEASLFSNPGKNGGVPRNTSPNPSPSPRPAPRAETKVIGGKTYTKINGEWYEQ